MPLEVLNGPVIEGRASLSSGIDCSAGPVVRITMPATWTPANISFQVSSDGEFYNDVFDAAGNEIIRPVTAGTAVPVDRKWFPMVAFLKIRSGSRKAPVEQAARREFAVAIDVPAAEAPPA